MSLFLFGISKTLRICRHSVGNLEALVKPILTAKWPGSTKPKHFVISEGSCKLKSIYSMNTLWGGLWDINRITQPVLSGLVISDEASSGLSVNLSTASASLSVYNQGRFVPGPLVTEAESLYLSGKSWRSWLVRLMRFESRFLYCSWVTTYLCLWTGSLLTSL